MLCDVEVGDYLLNTLLLSESLIKIIALKLRPFHVKWQHKRVKIQGTN